MDHESRQGCGSRSSPLSISPLTLNRRRPPYLVNFSVADHFSETEHCASTPSDSAVKQILLTMNERDNFIVEDLDDFHIIIKADEEYRVRKQLELEVRRCPPPHLSKYSAYISLSWRRTRTVWNDSHITKQYDKRCVCTSPDSSSRPHTPAISLPSSTGI